ncbi:MAG TPA: 30S ribosomal protein S4 [Candidatus Andersenbacteria bacterium]|nr:30S ribosomal protein S4 [Candidatus Andersenbacteria bacterium]
MPQPSNPQQKQQQQGRRRRPQSRYGVGLQEKQSLKKIFGLREEQLKRYYKQALKFKGQTGPTLIALLERRLDNAIFRSGFAQTRPQARQMTTHRLFTVNGQPVDVPSYSLKPGDVVAVRESKRAKSYFSSFDKRMQNHQSPSWILVNPEAFGFTVTAAPSYEEANVGVDVRVVVEFFAR